MWKKHLCIRLAALFLFCTLLVTTVSAETKEPDASQLYAKACALVDGSSGRLLYGKEEETALANASTTKILTCILALELCETDEVVTFSANAAAQPKVHLGAQEGEQFYLLDLLYALMLESYNDCAYAIAEHAAGSVEAFAEKMNEKATALGCTDSHFVTPNGLDGEDDGGMHHTTAYDLCRIMSYCTWDSPKSAQFLSITQESSHTFSSLSGTGYAVSNKNAFLGMMDHVLTGKTGYTAKAGYCYVAALEEGGRRYAIALLACGWPNHSNYRWSDAKTLFTYGMDNYHLYQGSADIALPELSVGGGFREGTLDEWSTHAALPLYADADEKQLTFLLSDTDEAEIQKTMDPLTLPIQKGQELGTVSYCINGETAYTASIRAGADVGIWDLKRFLTVLWKEALPV